MFLPTSWFLQEPRNMAQALQNVVQEEPNAHRAATSHLVTHPRPGRPVGSVALCTVPDHHCSISWSPYSSEMVGVGLRLKEAIARPASYERNVTSTANTYCRASERPGKDFRSNNLTTFPVQEMSPDHPLPVCREQM